MVMKTRKSASFVALVEDVKNRDKNDYDVSSIPGCYQKRITLAVPNMDLLNGSECTARLRKGCKKLVNPSMEDINSYMKDGTKRTIPKVFVRYWVD